MGHDETRGKAASDSPKPADEGTNPVSELTDLHSAFDSIDDSMKEVGRREVTVTPETLEQIVNDAVAKAITKYEQARGATPEASPAPQGGAAAPDQARDIAPRQPADPAAVPRSPWQANLERLQGDMGLDEIEFDSAAAEPAETAVHRTLSAQMGVHDFEFDDVPGAAAEPAVAVPLDIDAVAEWMNTPAAAPDVDQVTPDVDQLRATAVGKPKTGDADEEFDWVVAELAELDAAQARTTADQPAAPPDPEPPPFQAPEAVAPAIEQPRAESKPEVRDTRRGVASWFRSALGDKSPQREPAAAVPDPEPTAPPMSAASSALQPEPEVEAPAPVAAKPEEKRRSTRDPAATLKPLGPEAADTRFTFDPIPPVPPRLPREPNEPPKRIKKSGTFL